MSFFADVRKLTQPYDGDDEQYFTDEPEPDDEPTVVAGRRESAAPLREMFERKKPAAFVPEADEEPFAPQPREVVYQSEGRESDLRRADEPRAREVTVGVETQMQVVTLRPERYDQLPAIAEHLIGHSAVIVNLEAASKELGRRIVDFLAGVTYTVGGEMKKIAINTYVVTPHRIGDLNRLVDELENKGISFY